ncbi:MAG TPA: hypothetical protein VMA53_02600 [Stellaceae bacterium]|nr:hypothetical protein [Stellaceae bacterium]
MDHHGNDVVVGAALLRAVEPPFLFLLDLSQLRVPLVVRRFTSRQRRTEMLDAIMLAATVAFFVLAIAYVAACDRM